MPPHGLRDAKFSPLGLEPRSPALRAARAQRLRSQACAVALSRSDRDASFVRFSRAREERDAPVRDHACRSGGGDCGTRGGRCGRARESAADSTGRQRPCDLVVSLVPVEHAERADQVHERAIVALHDGYPVERPGRARSRRSLRARCAGSRCRARRARACGLRGLVRMRTIGRPLYPAAVDPARRPVPADRASDADGVRDPLANPAAVLAARQRPMAERLALALSWNRLASQLRSGLAEAMRRPTARQ